MTLKVKDLWEYQEGKILVEEWNCCMLLIIVLKVNASGRLGRTYRGSGHTCQTTLTKTSVSQIAPKYVYKMMDSVMLFDSTVHRCVQLQQ